MTSFDPEELSVIEDDLRSGLSNDPSEATWERRMLSLCEYTRQLQGALKTLSNMVHHAEKELL